MSVPQSGQHHKKSVFTSGHDSTKTWEEREQRNLALCPKPRERQWRNFKLNLLNWVTRHHKSRETFYPVTKADQIRGNESVILFFRSRFFLPAFVVHFSGFICQERSACITRINEGGDIRAYSRNWSHDYVAWIARPNKTTLSEFLSYVHLHFNS